VVIVGGGFAGLNAAKGLVNAPEIDVTLLDARNHHLFQPLLYQVATAGLSPAEIAAPIRAILTYARNIRVLQEQVVDVDLSRRMVVSDSGEHSYDYVLLACGSKHAYFGHDAWEMHAPGLKTLEQATEIRRRVLTAFEEAEKEASPERKRVADLCDRGWGGDGGRTRRGHRRDESFHAGERFSPHRSTIGRRRAILQSGRIKFGGFAPWMSWLLVHIYYLTGFRSRTFVVLQWAWSYFSYGRGARLIVGKAWRFYGDDDSMRP